MANERHRGDKVQGIPVDDWNEFVRTSKQFAQIFRHGATPGQSSGTPVLTVEVFNRTGEAISAAYPVLKLDTPTVTLEDRDNSLYDPITFEGETPDANTDIGDIAIVQGPIASNREGCGIISGPAPCEINVTDAAHTHAAPKDADNTKLESGTTGAKIIWKEAGTGTKKAVVMLGTGGSGGDVNFRLAIVTTTISPATGWAVADAGSGMIQYIDDDGAASGTDIECLTRYFDEVIENTPIWVWVTGSTVIYIINAGCTPGPDP